MLEYLADKQIEVAMYDLTTSEGLTEAALCEVMGYGEVPLLADERASYLGVYQGEGIWEFLRKQEANIE